MKVAHIIIFHEDPTGVERLLKAMFHPDFDFYLHLDKKVDMGPYSYLAELPNVTFIKNRKLVNWGGFSQVEASLNSITEIVASGKEYEFINLLSGQDYPIKPASYIHEFLSRKRGLSFMMSESAPSDWWNHATSRFSRYHLVDYQFKGKFRLGKLISNILPERKFPLQVDLFGGPHSAYWTMNIIAARYIIKKINKHDKHWQFYQHTWGSDEFLMNTILMNSPLKHTIVNENFHLMDRSMGGARPKVLTVHDFEMLQSSKKFFARKLDSARDHKILNMIDELLLFQAPQQNQPQRRTLSES